MRVREGRPRAPNPLRYRRPSSSGAGWPAPPVLPLRRSGEGGVGVMPRADKELAPKRCLGQVHLAGIALGDCGVNTARRGARGPFRGIKGGIRAPPRPPPRLRRRGSMRKPHRTRSLERREGVNVNDADAPSTGATGVFAVHGIRVSKATTLHHHHTFSVPRPRRGRGPLQNSNEPRGCRRGRAGQAGLQVGREMAEAGAGADQGPEDSGAPETAGPGPPRAGSGWAGLPEDLLVKVAGKLVAQSEAAQAAHLGRLGCSEEQIQEVMAKRKRDGNCLFVFAMVCKPWRKAQLKVGGPLRTGWGRT